MSSLLDYEIHVLRKHEEEIVLVKSEQKRKITIFQDSINKLRRKVRSTNSHIAKEESALHENIANIRSSSSHVFTIPESTNFFTKFPLFCFSIRQKFSIEIKNDDKTVYLLFEFLYNVKVSIEVKIHYKMPTDLIIIKRLKTP